MNLKKEKISLLLADVDGTLVDSQKRITERAAGAIENLEAAKVSFAITSGRPPRGMKMIAEKVKLSAPIAAFNGGMMVDPNTIDVLTARTLDAGVAKGVIDAIAGFGLDVWVYAGVDCTSATGTRHTVKRRNAPSNSLLPWSITSTRRLPRGWPRWLGSVTIIP